MTAVSTPRKVPPRPQVRPDIEFLAPGDGESAWTVADPATGRFTRLGNGAAMLLRSLDGNRDLKAVRTLVGPAVPESVLHATLRQFTDLGLLVGTERPRLEQRRIRFSPPASLQLTVLDRPRFLAPGRWIPRVLSSRAAVALCAVAVLAALAAVVVGSVHLTDMARQPQPWQYWVIAVAVAVVSNGIHELAHAAVLARFGGRPRRLGLMLFYLAPAMFCDVSDVWRLRGRHQRVLVALAGVICQITAASLLALSSALTSGTVGEVLSVCAVMTALTGIFNLLPFIKLDGYIALMAWVDIPNLRDKSMADARAVTAWLLFGGARPARQLSGGWTVFGVGCILLPWLLGARILTIAQSGLMAFGPLGAATWLALLAAVVGYLLQRLARLYRTARPRTPLRGILTLTAGAALLALLGQSQSCTPTTEGAYALSGTRVTLWLPDAPGVARPAPGGKVTLAQRGILGRLQVGTAVTGDALGTASVPLEPFLPIKGVGGRLDARQFRLQHTTMGTSAPSEGIATAQTEPTTWTAYLTKTWLTSPWTVAASLLR
ncbi:daptide biosynthesis intramembrane metalloprotease [Streptomyces chrestomyceticus]|uniref:daptide biosynthesis intramembrane metalloprotease n=1 Tax=Streptomyces chrestomyceticus TaxID=68185 RepID=UPI0035A85D15